MSKERLKKFKQELDFLDDSNDMEDYHRLIDTLKNLYGDGELHWIYRYAKEQAERVQVLEQWVFETKPYIKSLEKQNKRYRTLLERVCQAEDMEDIWNIEDDFIILEESK